MLAVSDGIAVGWVVVLFLVIAIFIQHVTGPDFGRLPCSKADLEKSSVQVFFFWREVVTEHTSWGIGQEDEEASHVGVTIEQATPWAAGLSSARELWQTAERASNFTH